jgi:intracellular sulfur oxidation DsrE/DsrF family protein
MLGLIVFSGMAHADKQKLVIQVSSADPQTQTLALNNAVNAQKSLGMDNVDIEVVAYGPGLSILTKQNQASQRVASLAIQDIRFSACGNTMAKIEQKTGKKPELTEGVEVVPGGVLRIMQLEQEGYAYIRP